MLFLCFEFLWGVWIVPLVAPYCAAATTAAAVATGGGEGAAAVAAAAGGWRAADLLAWPQSELARHGVEAVYMLLSVLSFINILYFVMGFEKYGRC
jgi:hypothetical protein